MTIRNPKSLFRHATHALFAGALFATTALFAGTPLICHPYDIGTAKSLPAGNDWHGVNMNYDRTNLVRDTVALLNPDVPVIVRMETLRRAAIYATAGMRAWDKGTYTPEDRAIASALLEKLRERAKNANDKTRAIAVFDVGFFTETLRQTNVDPSLNGYDQLVKALALRGPDADMEFALALSTSWPKRQERDSHLARARAGAKEKSLLATNLASHFSGS